jgi:hypothetical protein
LRVHGESIYGTRAGLIDGDGSCVSTRRGDVHYVHVLDYVSDCLRLRGVRESSWRATSLRDGSSVALERKGEVTVLRLLPEQRDPIDTVVRLDGATPRRTVKCTHPRFRELRPSWVAERRSPRPFRAAGSWFRWRLCASELPPGRRGTFYAWGYPYKHDNEPSRQCMGPSCRHVKPPPSRPQ